MSAGCVIVTLCVPNVTETIFSGPQAIILCGTAPRELLKI